MWTTRREKPHDEFEPHNAAELSVEEYLVLESVAAAKPSQLRKLWDFVSPSFVITMSSYYRQIRVDQSKEKIDLVEVRDIESLNEEFLKLTSSISTLHGIIEGRVQALWYNPLALAGLEKYFPIFEKKKAIHKDMGRGEASEGEEEEESMFEPAIGDTESITEPERLIEQVFPMGKSYIVYPMRKKGGGSIAKLKNLETLVSKALQFYTNVINSAEPTTAFKGGMFDSYKKRLTDASAQSSIKFAMKKIFLDAMSSSQYMFFDVREIADAKDPVSTLRRQDLSFNNGRFFAAFANRKVKHLEFHKLDEISALRQSLFSRIRAIFLWCELSGGYTTLVVYTPGVTQTNDVAEITTFKESTPITQYESLEGFNKKRGDSFVKSTNLRKKEDQKYWPMRFLYFDPYKTMDMQARDKKREFGISRHSPEAKNNKYIKRSAERNKETLDLLFKAKFISNNFVNSFGYDLSFTEEEKQKNYFNPTTKDTLTNFGVLNRSLEYGDPLSITSRVGTIIQTLPLLGSFVAPKNLLNYDIISEELKSYFDNLTQDRRILLKNRLLFKKTFFEPIHPWVESFYLTNLPTETPLRCLHIMLSLIKYDTQVHLPYDRAANRKIFRKGEEALEKKAEEQSYKRFFPYYTVDLQAALSGAVGHYKVDSIGEQLVRNRYEIPKNIGYLYRYETVDDIKRYKQINAAPFLQMLFILRTLLSKSKKE